MEDPPSLEHAGRMDAMVPEGGGGGGEQGVSISRKVQWIKRPGTIAPDDQFPE